MNNKELLFNLIKKLESGEIRFLFADGDNKECILKATSVKAMKVGEVEEVGIGKTLFAKKYNRSWNKEFKEKYDNK